jgi:hypothetical protein
MGTSTKEEPRIECADVKSLAVLWCTDLLPDVGAWTLLRSYRSGAPEASAAIYAELVPPPYLKPTAGLAHLIEAFSSKAEGASLESPTIRFGARGFVVDDGKRATAIFAPKKHLVCASILSFGISESIATAIEANFEPYDGSAKLVQRVLKDAKRACETAYDPLRIPEEWMPVDPDAGVVDVSPYLARTLTSLRSHPERPLEILGDDQRLEEKRRLLRYFRNPRAWRFAHVGRWYTPVAREQIFGADVLWAVRVDAELADPDIVLLRYDSESPFAWTPDAARFSQWCGLVELIADAMHTKRRGRSVDVEAIERRAEMMCRGLLFSALDLRRNLALLRDEDA